MCYLNLDVLSKVIDMFYFCNLKVFKSKVFAIKFLEYVYVHSHSVRRFGLNSHQTSFNKYPFGYTLCIFHVIYSIHMRLLM